MFIGSLLIVSMQTTSLDIPTTKSTDISWYVDSETHKGLLLIQKEGAEGFGRKTFRIYIQAWRSTTNYMTYVKGDCFDYIYEINVKLYTCKLLLSCRYVIRKWKERWNSNCQTKKKVETDKEKEKEELETLEMESTGGGKEGGGG